MNVRPGDLAIVVQAQYTPDLVGRIVKVIRPKVEDELFINSTGDAQTYAAKGFAWVCSAERVLPWVTHYGHDFYYERPIADHCLRPVSGLPMEDDVKDEVKEPA